MGTGCPDVVARTVAVTATEGDRLVTRQMQCLPLDFISGFLFGINADCVKPELKERVVRYQRECYEVLADAFREGRLTAEPAFDDLLANDSPAAQAYKMAAAIMQMARQQILLEAQVNDQASRLDVHEERLELIESTLGDPGRFVTPDQAMQISQAVRTVAMELGKRSKKNEYGAVYGQLYRQYGITSYKQLPANKFESAMKWLTDWYRRVTGATGGTCLSEFYRLFVVLRLRGRPGCVGQPQGKAGEFRHRPALRFLVVTWSLQLRRTRHLTHYH